MFMWQYLFDRVDEENWPCDKYICRKAGVLAFMRQTKAVTHEKKLM